MGRLLKIEFPVLKDVTNMLNPDDYALGRRLLEFRPIEVLSYIGKGTADPSPCRPANFRTVVVFRVNENY